MQRDYQLDPTKQRSIIEPRDPGEYQLSIVDTPCLSITEDRSRRINSDMVALGWRSMDSEWSKKRLQTGQSGR